jgi:hypothetical protein
MEAQAHPCEGNSCEIDLVQEEDVYEYGTSLPEVTDLRTEPVDGETKVWITLDDGQERSVTDDFIRFMLYGGPTLRRHMLGKWLQKELTEMFLEHHWKEVAQHKAEGKPYSWETPRYLEETLEIEGGQFIVLWPTSWIEGSDDEGDEEEGEEEEDEYGGRGHRDYYVGDWPTKGEYPNTRKKERMVDSADEDEEEADEDDDDSDATEDRATTSLLQKAFLSATRPYRGKELETCSICGVESNGDTFKVKARDRMRKTECKHKFHTECLWRWYKKSAPMPTCPLCRRRMF